MFEGGYKFAEVLGAVPPPDNSTSAAPRLRNPPLMTPLKVYEVTSLDISIGEVLILMIFEKNLF